MKYPLTWLTWPTNYSTMSKRFPRAIKKSILTPDLSSKTKINSSTVVVNSMKTIKTLTRTPSLKSLNSIPNPSPPNTWPHAINIILRKACKKVNLSIVPSKSKTHSNLTTILLKISSTLPSNPSLTLSIIWSSPIREICITILSRDKNKLTSKINKNWNFWHV